MKGILALLVITAMTLVSCGENTVTRSSFMMDTVITYSITNPGANKLINECDALIAKEEESLSAYIDGSLVDEFNKNGRVSLDYVPFEEIYYLACSVYAQTDGAFDITVAPLVKLWDITHAGDGWTPPSDAEVATALSHVGMDKLENGLSYIERIDDSAMIDLGGVAKGYVLGMCAELLSDVKYDVSGTLSFGGNIALIGTKTDGTPWNVGVKNPFDTSGIVGTLSLEAGIVSVSGSYERYVDYEGVRYHHIIDPTTGCPAESDLASVAVVVDTSDPFCDIAKAGAYADALSTALFVMGHDAALEHYDKAASGELDDGFVEDVRFEAVLIKVDGTVTVTDGISDRYTPNE